MGDSLCIPPQGWTTPMIHSIITSSWSTTLTRGVLKWDLSDTSWRLSALDCQKILTCHLRRKLTQYCGSKTTSRDQKTKKSSSTLVAGKTPRKNQRIYLINKRHV